MKRSAVLLFAVALSAGSVATTVAAQDALTKNPGEVRAGVYDLDPAHGKVTWEVSHLGFSTYIGQFSGTSAKLKLDPKNIAATTLEATIDMNSAGTLSEGLDKHLKAPDFFDSAKFPTATFKSTSVKSTGERTADVVGDLTLKGVTKPVTLHVTFNQAGPFPMNKVYSVGFDGAATINRSDFGVSFGVPMVSDEVKLRIEGEFKAAK